MRLRARGTEVPNSPELATDKCIRFQDDPDDFASLSGEVPLDGQDSTGRYIKRHRRTRPVFVDRMSTRPGRSETDLLMTIEPPSRSRSDHRKPHSSPRRHPVVAATKSSVANPGSLVCAASISALICSGDGAVASLRSIPGGVA